MARIRTIKPSYFTSEDICKRSPLARLLFAGLWTEADRDGFLADSPFQLRTRLLPNDDCDVDALLWELASSATAAPLIRRYTASNGKPYIQILAFVEHQRPHPKEPKSAIPTTGTDRIPGRAVIKNGGQVLSPGDIPSSPVGREGDLEYGDLGREGKGREPAGALPLVNGGRLITSSMDWFKQHGRHADGFCDWMCFPQSSFTRFVNLVMGSGATEVDAISQVRAWADDVRRQWTTGARPGVPGSDIFKFWDHEWEATHGSNRPAAGAVDVLAGLRI